MSDEKCNLTLQALQFHITELKEDDADKEIRLTRLEKLAKDITAVKFVAYGIGIMVLSETIGLTAVLKGVLL